MKLLSGPSRHFEQSESPVFPISLPFLFRSTPLLGPYSISFVCRPLTPTPSTRIAFLPLLLIPPCTPSSFWEHYPRICRSLHSPFSPCFLYTVSSDGMDFSPPDFVDTRVIFLGSAVVFRTTRTFGLSLCSSASCCEL